MEVWNDILELDELKEQWYKIFYIKWVFDLLHEWHIALLEYLNKKIKDKYWYKTRIIIWLEWDNIVKNKKWKNRPYENENLRKEKLKNTWLIEDVYILHKSASFLLEELELLKVDYFIIPDEYIKHIKLFYILKNKLKKRWIKVFLSRHKQYKKYWISYNLSLIHTTNIIEERLFNKLLKSVRHNIYLTKEMLYLISKR
jgi:glycerol-3-phosphate cytidylyltransferase-like family protein